MGAKPCQELCGRREHGTFDIPAQVGAFSPAFCCTGFFKKVKSVTGQAVGRSGGRAPISERFQEPGRLNLTMCFSWQAVKRTHIEAAGGSKAGREEVGASAKWAISLSVLVWRREGEGVMGGCVCGGGGGVPDAIGDNDHGHK